MGKLVLTGITGMSSISLAPNVFDVALNDTDISFTLYQNYQIKDLKPEDRVIILMDYTDGCGGFLKWVGSNDRFIEDVYAFARLIELNNAKRFCLCLFVVERIDPDNNKMLGSCVPKNERWVVDCDANGTINIDAVM